MSTSNTFKKISLGNGFVLEYGTFTTTSTETTHSITADTTEQPEVVEIVAAGASSNNDTAVICALDGASNVLKLTFNASDDGKYWFIGKAK